MRHITLTAVAVAVVGLGAVGCTFERDEEAEELVGEAEQSVLTENALISNALSMNALTQNSVTQNSVTQNSVTQNSVTQNSVTQNSVTQNALTQNALTENATFMAALEDTTPSAGKGSPTRGRLTRSLLEYVYSCAMPPPGVCSSGNRTNVLDIELSDERLTLEGQLGVAPEWGTAECDLDCQRWVSACVLARTNAYGTPVDVSLRAVGHNPALAVSEAEASEYTLHEGAFYGNIFNREDLATPRQGCTGEDADMAQLLGRICASPGGHCPIFISKCTDRCDDATGCKVKLKNGSSARIPGIKVHLKPPPAAVCGDEICDVGEAAASCPKDCKPVMDSRSFGFATSTSGVVASTQGPDGSVVMVGITGQKDLDLGYGPIAADTASTRNMYFAWGTRDTALWGRRFAIGKTNLGAGPVWMDPTTVRVNVPTSQVIIGGVGFVASHSLVTGDLIWQVQLPCRVDSITPIEGSPFSLSVPCKQAPTGGGPLTLRRFELALDGTHREQASRPSSPEEIVQRDWLGATYSALPAGPGQLIVSKENGWTTPVPVPSVRSPKPVAMQALTGPRALFVAGTSEDRASSFIVKLGDQGQVLWTTELSSDGHNAVRIVKIGQMSGTKRTRFIVVGGSFKGTVDFAGTAGSQILKSRRGHGDNDDVFVAAYDAASGKLRWIQTFGGAAADALRAFTFDSTNHLWAFGSFTGMALFPGRYLEPRESLASTNAFQTILGPIDPAL